MLKYIIKIIIAGAFATRRRDWKGLSPFPPHSFRPEGPVTVAAIKQLSRNKKRGEDA